VGTADPVPDDQALLQGLVRRDERALAALYDRHGRAAFALAYRLIGDAETAEEVVQETFLALWRRAETYRPERGTVRAWLLTVVRNRSIDALRQRDGRPRTGPPPPRPVPLDDLRLIAPDDPEDEALRRVDGREVRRALTELPREQREVVELAYFGGLAYPEVAAITGAPVGTVKSRMRLALERLRAVLVAREIGS
jgi:RNA polymerase sigma-70 factor (ECF subfamily)